MWAYEKRLQFPVKIKKTCPKTAQLIISQYGGPDGELSASMRYLAQRYTMPVKEVGGLLTDIRHRRTRPYGNNLRNGISAYKRPFHAGNQRQRI